MRSCRLVLETKILTLLGDADSMTTFIATCLMHSNGPSAPCLTSPYQYYLASSPRGSDLWALLMLGLSSTLSINWGQLLARCVLIERSHVDLKRGETTCESLVDMEWEKTHWETGHSTLLLALWPLLVPFFHRLSQQTIWFIVGPLPTLVLLNHVVVLPSRLPPNRSVSVVIVFLATSLRDRNTFKQLMSESCCVVEFSVTTCIRILCSD